MTAYLGVRRAFLPVDLGRPGMTGLLWVLSSLAGNFFWVLVFCPAFFDRRHVLSEHRKSYACCSCLVLRPLSPLIHKGGGGEPNSCPVSFVAVCRFGLSDVPFRLQKRRMLRFLLVRPVRQPDRDRLLSVGESVFSPHDLMLYAPCDSGEPDERGTHLHVRSDCVGPRPVTAPRASEAENSAKLTAVIGV
jgi:hypothetical protein